MNFGRMLRSARKARHVTLMELADKSGLHFSHISNIERGRCPPPGPTHVAKICGLLAVDPKPFFEEIAIEKEQTTLLLETDVQRKFGVALMRAYAAGDEVLVRAEKLLTELLQSNSLENTSAKTSF
jgi:transcriptional regulator with XRE-family HTH domain